MYEHIKHVPVGFFAYEVRLSLFRKRPVVSNDLFDGEYVLCAIRHKWANVETREFSWTTEILKNPQEILDAGQAVFDHRSRTMLMPGDTFPAFT